MPRKYHRLDCPDCIYNRDDFACTNPLLTRRSAKHLGPTFSVFKGETSKRCKFKVKRLRKGGKWRR